MCHVQALHVILSAARPLRGVSGPQPLTRARGTGPRSAASSASRRCVARPPVISSRAAGRLCCPLRAVAVTLCEGRGAGTFPPGAALRVGRGRSEVGLWWEQRVDKPQNRPRGQAVRTEGGDGLLGRFSDSPWACSCPRAARARSAPCGLCAVPPGPSWPQRPFACCWAGGSFVGRH